MIQLSHFTKALLENLKKIAPKASPDEYSKLTVSQTASFFAIAYEKIRNAVEYRENHLIRRAAIERILRRRLILNPEGENEGENLIRELLWARYFPQESLSQQDIEKIQQIIDKYLILMKSNGKSAEFLTHLMTCEIEEALSPEEAQRYALQTFYMFQILKNKVKIEHVTQEEQDIFLYISLEKLFAKSDISYLHYHLAKLLNDSVSLIANEDMKKIDDYIKNPYTDRLRRFVKTQIPPFKILFKVIELHKANPQSLLENRENLWLVVEKICQERYAKTASRLRTLAIKAIIYIFLTKMIFALALEVPLSIHFFGDINYTALVINSVFPPILMFLIVGLTKVPGAENTKRVYDRLVDIIDADKSYETGLSFMYKKAHKRKASLLFAFTIVYGLTFVVTFSFLFFILSTLGFNIVSEVIFVFFVSLVAFFAYRIRQVAKEYKLQEKDPVFRPFLDFFFMPFLALGKALSSGIAKLNFLTAILDFLIEAPFKLIIEIVEEWINFIRARRDEIV